LSQPGRTVVRMVSVAEIEVGTTADTLLGRPVFDGLVLVQAGLAKLLHADVDTHHLYAALELIDSVDSMGRQFDAVFGCMIII
jgi:hypothetical protein